MLKSLLKAKENVCKCEPKYTFSERNKNQTAYLKGRCYLQVFLTDCYLFCLEASLLFLHSFCVWFFFYFILFFNQFLLLGGIYGLDTARRAVCLIAPSVQQLNPLFQRCSHTHIVSIHMQCLISCCLACELCVCFCVFCQCLLISGWSFFTYQDIQSSQLPVVPPWQKMKSTSFHFAI